jgi:arylsulfatase A-like enzyme
MQAADIRRTRGSIAGRALGVAFAVAVAAAGVSGGAGEEAEAQRARPNILLVLTDDQRWDTMWAMPSVRHRIGGKGVTFRNGFVVNSLCCPSRASLLSGDYSHTTGVYTNRPPTGGYEVFDDEETLPVWLDRGGYRTAFVGKYLNGYGRLDIGYIPPGWDRWIAFAGSRARTVYYDYWLSVNGTKERFGKAPKAYSTDVYTDYAARFVKRSKDPFFLLYAPSAPHRPARPAPRHLDSIKKIPRHRPPNFDEVDVSDKPAWVRSISPLSREAKAEIRTTRKNQLRSLLAVDEGIHRLMDILERQNELENTLVIFTSDNGLLWGEHRWRTKQVAYEEAIRVPLLIRSPEGVIKDAESESFALNIDLAPTIADYADVSHPSTDGTSIRPLLLNPESQVRSSFLIEHLQEPKQDKPPTYCAVRNENFAYVAYETGEEELYDMRIDPFQRENYAENNNYRFALRNMRDLMRAQCSPPPPGFNPMMFGG